MDKEVAAERLFTLLENIQEEVRQALRLADRILAPDETEEPDNEPL